MVGLWRAGGRRKEGWDEADGMWWLSLRCRMGLGSLSSGSSSSGSNRRRPSTTKASPDGRFVPAKVFL